MNTFLAFMSLPFCGGEYVGRFAEELGLSYLGGFFLWGGSIFAWILLGTIIAYWREVLEAIFILIVVSCEMIGKGIRAILFPFALAITMISIWWDERR